MKWLQMICMAIALVLAGGAAATAALSNGAMSELGMDVTLTLSDGCAMTFYSGHGMNGADAYVKTVVGGVTQENEQNLGVWPNDTASWSASASTSNGAAHGSVTVITPGFAYQIHGDALVEGLAINDYGYALGDGYAWPDWLNCTSLGTATLTISYTYTLDTTDTIDDARSWVYMNAFFADHVHVNHLVAQGDWTIGYGSNPNTTIAEYTRSIAAGDSLTVTDSVSWAVDIPNIDEPNNWWSIWAYGEAGVEVEPVPEPATLALMALGGVLTFLGRRRRK